MDVPMWWNKLDVENRTFLERKKHFAGRGWSKELLAREVLAEIPDQLLSYMKSKGFQPPKAAAAAAPQLPAAT